MYTRRVPSLGATGHCCFCFTYQRNSLLNHSTTGALMNRQPADRHSCDGVCSDDRRHSMTNRGS